MHRERVLRPVSGDDEKLDDDVGQPQGRRRHLVLVLGGEHLRHVPRLRGCEENLGADQRPGQIGAQHRDEQPDADETAPQCPTTASSTVAMDGCRIPAISGRSPRFATRNPYSATRKKGINANRPEAPELFRKVMFASASVPIAFPPVLFEVEAGGWLYARSHDGAQTPATSF